MKDIKPLVVVLDDRFNGKYSGGKWTAWNMCYVPSKIFGEDKECADFFAKENLIFGRGETPEEAIEDLKHRLVYGTHMAKEHIKAVSESTEDEEEEKMEPTSVCRIENIEDIWIDQDVDGMSLMLKNKDDLTKIVMTGDAIDNFNDKFVISLQADMIEYAKDMRKLKKENEELKEKSKYISNENALFLTTNVQLLKKKSQLQQRVERLLNENMKLREEYENKLDDIQRKYEGALREKYQIKDEYDKLNESLKNSRKDRNELNQKLHQVIKDKERLTDRYKDLEKQYNEFSDDVALIHGIKYTVEGLVDRILELEKLKTPTLENFADEEPSSRRDILRCAEKCVCGQREQDYGTPESNFQLIADLWNDYLKKEQSSVVVDAMDVSMMMALLKIARIRNGGGSGDSFVDLAGYAACGGEIWAGKKHQKDLN